MEVLDYERLVADFETKLVTQLRSMGAEADYLEIWVPDANPVKSILNMVEAAEAFGRDEIAVRVALGTLTAEQASELMKEVAGLGHLVVRPENDHTLIIVTGIGKA